MDMSASGWTRAGASALVSSIALLMASSDAAPVPKTQYVFVSTVDEPVVAYQGQDWVIGRLDLDGNFTQVRPERHSRTDFFRSATGRILYVGNSPYAETAVPTAAYEFRSGRLIKGEQLWDGSFVPEL